MAGRSEPEEAKPKPPFLSSPLLSTTYPIHLARAHKSEALRYNNLQ